MTEYKEKVARIRMAARSSNTTILIRQALEDALFIAAELEKVQATPEPDEHSSALTKKQKELDAALLLLEEYKEEIAALKGRIDVLSRRPTAKAEDALARRAKSILALKAAAESDRKMEEELITKLKAALESAVALKEKITKKYVATHKTGICSSCHTAALRIIAGKCPRCYAKSWAEKHAATCACGKKTKSPRSTRCLECWEQQRVETAKAQRRK